MSGWAGAHHQVISHAALTGSVLQMQPVLQRMAEPRTARLARIMHRCLDVMVAGGFPTTRGRLIEPNLKAKVVAGIAN